MKIYFESEAVVLVVGRVSKVMVAVVVTVVVVV